jgi:hypothetical protein
VVFGTGAVGVRSVLVTVPGAVVVGVVLGTVVVAAAVVGG